jgi:hypothetical protein
MSDIEKKNPTKAPAKDQAGIVDKSKSSLMTSAAPLVDDGFAGWEDGVEGDDRPVNAGLIQGTHLKFSNDGRWIDRNGNEISGNLELCVAEVIRLVQKWQDQYPVEIIILKPHEKFPNIEAKNEATPRDEWGEDQDGNPRGPWQAEKLLRLVNLETMDKYSYPTGTIGGEIAIRELVERINWMRRYKGNDVYVIVTLGRIWWELKRGGRWKPHFIIKRWVRLGGGGGGEELPPSQEIPPTPIAAPVQQVSPQSDLPLVAEPTLQEELNDSIPDFDKPEPPQQSKPQPAKPAPQKSAPNQKTTARRDLKKNPQKPSKPAGKKQTILDAG